MKFDCGPTWREKVEQTEQWHAWFAWFPVRLGSHDCRWLEWIARKGTICSTYCEEYWVFDYKPLEFLNDNPNNP